MGCLGRDVRGTVGKAWEAVGPRLAAPPSRNARAECLAGWVVLKGTCRGVWGRRGRLLAPDLQRHLHGTALRKAAAFHVFPSSCLIFVLYCEGWLREEAGES